MLRRSSTGRTSDACWGSDDGKSFFDGVLSGASCNNNWYEGSIEWQQYDSRTDYPGLLGFDDSIAWYCQNHGRRLDATRLPPDADLHRDALANETHAGGRGNAQSSAERRRLDSNGDARNCIASHNNILMLFSNNVHGTGAGYNSCRNFEWQMCAAMGKLPGQRSPTVVFAKAPKELDTSRGRSLAHCGGWAPKGCPPNGYSNDDIYFLEVCLYSLACTNNVELFTIGAAQPFHCQVNSAGFRKLQGYLTS